MTQSDTLYRVTYRVWDLNKALTNTFVKFTFAQAPYYAANKVRNALQTSLEIEKIEAVMKANELVGEEWS